MEKKEKPFHGYNEKKHAKTGGLNDKERDLKRPQPEGGPRKRSFCARMSGVKGPTSKDGKLTPKGAALKRWKCSKTEEKIPGGLASKKDIKKFPKELIEQGRKVEMEHTSDPAVAREIAADHLTEDRKYYDKLSEMEKSKNVREQRKRIFGESGEPNPDRKASKPFYQKQAQALNRLSEKRYGMPIAEATGKFQYTLRDVNKMRAKQGKAPITIEEARNHPDYEVANPKVTTADAEMIRLREQKSNPKPDWRSGQFQAQRHVGAKAHEMGHLEISPENKPIGDLQTVMDEGSSIAGSKYQGMPKQTEYEVQPMAAEEAIRRRAGIPQFNRPQYGDPRRGHATEELTEQSPERTTLDTGRKYGKRLKDKEGKLYDLVGMSSNLSDVNRQRMKDIDEGILTFHPEHGWQQSQSPDALINLRAQGRGEEAKQRLQQKFPAQPKKMAASEDYELEKNKNAKNSLLAAAVGLGIAAGAPNINNSNWPKQVTQDIKNYPQKWKDRRHHEKAFKEKAAEFLGYKPTTISLEENGKKSTAVWASAGRKVSSDELEGYKNYLTRRGLDKPQMMAAPGKKVYKSKEEDTHSKGVHKPAFDEDSGTSEAGAELNIYNSSRTTNWENKAKAKQAHKKVISELKRQPIAKLPKSEMAKTVPTEVKESRRKAAIQEEKQRGVPKYKKNPDGNSDGPNRPNQGHHYGINHPWKEKAGSGESVMGHKIREPGQWVTSAKDDAKRTLRHLKEAPNPSLPKSESSGWKITEKSEEFEKASEGMDKRCWEGYESVPGKKAYSKGSCKRIAKSKTLEHYSPQEDLKEIDPSKARTGVDARAKHHQTEHPHSFYYTAGATPEDEVKGAARSKYTVQLPEHASIYDLSTDPHGIVSEAIEQNNGALNMDMVHAKLKEAGHHGFMVSGHPVERMRSVVGLYHSQPVKEEEKL
jgi:hypothetical protein